MTKHMKPILYQKKKRANKKIEISFFYLENQ